MKGFAKILTVNIGLIFITFALAEGAARIYGYFFISSVWATSWTNIAESMNIDKLQGNYYPAAFDSVIGHVPKPGVHMSWGGAIVTIGPDGTRSNGTSTELPAKPSILAVGDSFTYGDQVNDAETWPAQLEKTLNIRTLNAGVFGYGLDQTVLMAERQLKTQTPDILIVGIIPDDINRTELSVRTGIAKPVFTISDDRLELIPAENNKSQGKKYQHLENIAANLRAVFGYSFLIHHMMFRLVPEYWLSKRLNVREHNDGVQVSCRLAQRIANLQVKTKLLLMQYPAHNIISNSRGGDVEMLLDCARNTNLIVVDSFSKLRAIFERDFELFNSLYFGHMSPSGNRFIASLLAAKIEKRQLTE